MQESFTMKKRCYAPVINPPGSIRQNKKMGFYEINPDNNMWSKNIYGIDEPNNGERALMWSLSAILMPLVAFDKQGNRLGMGGGYYDTTFQHYRQQGVASSAAKLVPRTPILVGVAYDLQQVAKVPTETTDIKLDYVVTETGWIECQAN